MHPHFQTPGKTIDLMDPFKSYEKSTLFNSQIKSIHSSSWQHSNARGNQTKRNETKRKPSKQLIAILSINQHPIRSDMISYVMGICHSHMYVRDEVYNITFLT
jgi:hypothetical protein